MANALWGQLGQAWLKGFLTTTSRCYGAGLRQVDFNGAAEAARKTINAWVAEQTRRKIRELLNPGTLDKQTRLVLTNAIYFKGDWASKFEKEQTRTMAFRLGDGTSCKVPMMVQKRKFLYAEDPGLQILSLPYKGDDLSMVILLPKRIDGLRAQTRRLTTRNLATWTARLRLRPVHVYLPRFRITSGFGLAKTLTRMGMGVAFGSEADFSGMTGRKDLYISTVVHEAFVDVNEEGTEGAAATAVRVKLNGGRRPPSFRADRPFLLAIRHNATGAILFLGRLVNPAQ